MQHNYNLYILYIFLKQLILSYMFFTCLLGIVVNGLPTGAPLDACGSVTDVVPNHGSNTELNTDCPYVVGTYEFHPSFHFYYHYYYYYYHNYDMDDRYYYMPGFHYYSKFGVIDSIAMIDFFTLVDLYLSDFNITGFRGFMIQGRTMADDSPVGTFFNYSTIEPLCDNDVRI